MKAHHLRIDDSLFDHDHQSKLRKRKARTVFTDEQLKGLENEYQINKYLSTSQRSVVANVLALNETQVKTWFQNRRMKAKKQEAVQKSSSHPYSNKLKN